jgi:S-adenosylmethionine decarboxylase proenzyme
MNTHATHLALDIWLDGEVRPQDLLSIENCVRKTFRVVAEAKHQFDPQGLTRVFILSESHFCLHTYPEHRYLSIDVYACDANINLAEFADLLLSKLQVRDYRVQHLDRGIPTGSDRKRSGV